MPDIIRTRETRYRDEYSSDDERSSSYGGRSRHGGGYKTVQRYRVTARGSQPVEEIDDERSSRSDRLEVGTRHHNLEVDRRVERVERIERPRSALEYREPEREREVRRTVVYERDETRDRSPQTLSPRPWERERDRAWERERDVDVKIERRHRDRDDEPVEVERFTRETDYYGRADPQTTVVRQRERDNERRILEAAAVPAAYEMVRREQVIDNREVVPRRQEEYYFKQDVRDEPRRDELVRRDHRERRSVSEESDDGSEVIIRKERRVIRERSRSPRHKLHIAEGALAGAGAAALLANHRDKTGNSSGHRGRKVVAGAALGALGAELVTRARSRMRTDNSDDDERERPRSRARSRARSRSSSKDNHTKLKAGLALAATALVTAAAAKYVSSRNERKEEAGRGRSRTRSVSRRRRYSSDDGEPISKHSDTKHRAATMAKAAAGTAAVAAVVEHFRNKSRGRSKSRLRTGAAVAATGLAGAAVAGLYEARKAKQDAADDAARGRNHKTRSLSRPRSVYSDPGADPELGMVEYGTNPIHAVREYDPAAEAAERSRERRKRSRSRVKDIASGALASGAAAIGINHYQKRKERKEAERERRRYEEEAPPDNYYANESYDDGYSPSPPRHSGGAYYPEQVPPPVPPPGFTEHPTSSTPYVNQYPPQPPFDPAHNPAYYPPDVHGTQVPPMDPYGHPTAPRDLRDGGNVSSTTLFAPQPQTPRRRDLYNMTDEEGLISPSLESISSAAATVSPANEAPHDKSVAFAPLSPTSTRHLDKSRRRRNSDPSSNRPNTPSQHRRRHRNASRSPSPTSSNEIEVLPDRFDKTGRPLDANGQVYDRQPEMVERIVHDFEDVLEGRQSWRSLLRGFFDEANDRGGGRRR